MYPFSRLSKTHINTLPKGPSYYTYHFIAASFQGDQQDLLGIFLRAQHSVKFIYTLLIQLSPLKAS